jgi:hypothetical protein
MHEVGLLCQSGVGYVDVIHRVAGHELVLLCPAQQHLLHRPLIGYLAAQLTEPVNRQLAGLKCIPLRPLVSNPVLSASLSPGG